MLIKIHGTKLNPSCRHNSCEQLNKHNFYNPLPVGNANQLITLNTKFTLLQSQKQQTQCKKFAPGPKKQKTRLVCLPHTTKASPMTAAGLTLVFSSGAIKDVIKAVQLVNKLLTNLSSWLMTRALCCYGSPSKFKTNTCVALQLPSSQKLGLGFKALVAQQKHARVFSDFAQQFATKNMCKNVQKAPQSTSIFTVIRAAFVFKKTREQFAINNKRYYVTIAIQSKAQQNLLIQCLSLLKLPAEVKIISTC